MPFEYYVVTKIELYSDLILLGQDFFLSHPIEIKIA